MMNSLRNNFKQPGRDHNDKRQKRANAVTDGRKERRGRSFANRRNLIECEEMEEPNNDPLETSVAVKNTENQQQQQHAQNDNKPTSMKLRLLKWKEEKEKQRLKEVQLKARSRPPFKAGIVHHEKTPFVAALPPVPTVADKTLSKPESATSSGAFTFTGVQGRKIHTFKPTLKTAVPNTPGTAQIMPASKKKNAAAALPSAMKQPSVRFAADNKPQPQTRNLRSRVVTIASTPVAEKTAQTPTFSNKRRQRIPVTPYSNPRGRAGSTPASCKTASHVASTRSGGSSLKEANKENKPKSTGSAAKPAAKVASNTKQVPPTVTTRSERASRANRALKMASPVTPENNVEVLVAPETESSEKIAAAPDSSVKKTAETIKIEKKTPVSALRSKIPIQNPALSTDVPKKPVTATPVGKAKTPVKTVKTPLKQTPAKQPKEKEHDCPYFRAILAKTIERLEAECVRWEQEQEKAGDAVTEVANEQLLLATGMARLIIREKFAQFRGLIENCEANSEESKTTCTDLQGFWDMIYIQVEDIEKKFAELEKLKQNNWAPLEIKKNETKKKVILAKPKLNVVAKGRSNFRAFLAARNNNATTTESKDVPTVEAVEENPTVAAVPRRSLAKTPTVVSPVQRKKTASPKINAIWSASRTAKSAGRKSFTDDGGVNSSPMHGVQKSGMQPKGIPIPKSGKRKSSTSTPLQSILKNPVTPQSAFAKKMVVFSVPEEPEDDVLKSPIPPVKHTYSQHQSPMTYTEKDDEFDAVFYSANDGTPKMPTTPAGDKEIGLNESYTIEEPRTIKPPTPYVQRKGRTSARFVPYSTEQEEISDVDMDSDSDVIADTPDVPLTEKVPAKELMDEAVAVSPVKNQLSKLSVTASDQNVSLLYTPPTTVKQQNMMDCSIDLNNSTALLLKSASVKKGRRSSRIPVRVLNDETNLPTVTLTPAPESSNLNASKRSSVGADLICWDSPVEIGARRRSSRIRK